MQLHIEFLYDQARIRKLLHERGWRLGQAGGANRCAATHPTVVDQATARDRLQAAGLLTSAAVRIQFAPHVAKMKSRRDDTTEETRKPAAVASVEEVLSDDEPNWTRDLRTPPRQPRGYDLFQ